MNYIIKKNQKKSLQKKSSSQERNLDNNIVTKSPIRSDQQKTCRDCPPISQNQQTPIQNLNKKSFFSNNLQFQEQQDQQLKSKISHKLPRPMTSYKIDCDNLKLYTQNKNEQINLLSNQQNQDQVIVNDRQKQNGLKKITQNYENNIQKSENHLQYQILTIQDEQFQSNTNFTIPIIRKQSSTKFTLKNKLFKNQVDQHFQLKTEHIDTSPQDFQSTEANFFKKTDGNIQEINDLITNKKQNMYSVIQQSPNNYQTLKKSIYSEDKQRNEHTVQYKNFEEQYSPDSSEKNHQQQKPKKVITRLELIRQISNANLHENIHFQNISEQNQRNQILQPQNNELKFSYQLEQIFLNTTKYLFLKCQNQNCKYFCILTFFHKQDYYCQQCEMYSVIADVSAKFVRNKCNHTLNYKDIIFIVQNAISNIQLARCSTCKQEINYTLIQSIDRYQFYINIKYQLDLQMLKKQILKNPQYQIAECTQPDCNFFTIWDSKVPLLKQGFCMICNKRIAFKLEPNINFVCQINCGHELSAQKLLGLASDAQITKDFAKCSKCQVQISLKMFQQFESQGQQYIEYAINKQLDILKQQFDKKNEVVLSQCSTLSCRFFYVFQNKTIYNSQNQIVFSQQYNIENQMISSFCPNCNQMSISSEWRQRKNIQKKANIQIKTS